MAETREVVVRIKGSGNGKATPPAGSPGSSSTDKPLEKDYSDANPETIQQVMTTIATLIGKQAIGQAQQLAISGADYLINRSFYLSDDYIGQRNYTIAKTQTLKAINSARTIIGGAITGGPVGGALALSSVAMTYIGDLVGWSRNLDMQNIKIKEMDTQLEFSRQRAGYSLSAGSIGENL